MISGSAGSHLLGLLPLIATPAVLLYTMLCAIHGILYSIRYSCMHEGCFSFQQLKQTGWFEKLDSELDVWLEHSSKLDSVEFLEKILSTLFSNPYPYLDTVCQVVTGGKCHLLLSVVFQGYKLRIYMLLASQHFLCLNFNILYL